MSQAQLADPACLKLWNERARLRNTIQNTKETIKVKRQRMRELEAAGDTKSDGDYGRARRAMRDNERELPKLKKRLEQLNDKLQQDYGGMYKSIPVMFCFN